MGDNRNFGVRGDTVAVQDTRDYPRKLLPAVRGISWVKKKNKWVVQFRYKGRFYHVGYFLRREDAHRELLKARAAVKVSAPINVADKTQKVYRFHDEYVVVSRRG